MTPPYQIYQLKAFVENPFISYCFLRGAGGTGKTHTIAAFLKHFDIKAFEYIFVGPTGKSVSVAEEKGMYGSTIHRWFRIQNKNTATEIDRLILTEFSTWDRYYAEMKLKAKDIKFVFIDEVSMVNGDVLEHVLLTIKKSFPNGVKVFLSGDYAQLPAVIDLSNPLHLDLDTSLPLVQGLIQERMMTMVDFITRYRSDDEDYNQWLHDFKFGQFSDPRKIAEYLETKFNVYTDLPMDIQKTLTFLSFEKDVVDTDNQILLDELPGNTYRADVTILKDEYPIGQKGTRDKILEDYQYDDTVKFKVGAKILFRVNDPDNKFKNGDEGFIQEVKPGGSVIINKVTAYGESLIEVHKHIFKSSKMNIEDGFDITSEQVPFSLGFARTIHKSQGDGFLNLHLNLGFLNKNYLTSEFKFQLLYVALSRVIDPSKVYIHQDSINELKKAWIFNKVDYDKLNLNFDSDLITPQQYQRR